ncbi:response regulator [Planotetraspora thailandica]|uniref:Response regulator n=1 Tax=Planotetraspora thailandica TaxID=487172 RepID=A0A8J3Y056_9ACTN|nr:response regulator [Planotetraspora thailandica]GII58403.1 response regulator [Planotetraspora thailandica]
MALRCLVVDDNDYFLMIACDVLTHDGIEVVGVASTCAEAIRRAGELRPDVALIDIGLGDESGLDLVRELSATGRTDHPSIIMTSAYAEGDLAEMIADSPALGFLPKSRLSGQAISAIVGSAHSDGQPSCGAP